MEFNKTVEFDESIRAHIDAAVAACKVHSIPFVCMAVTEYGDDHMDGWATNYVPDTLLGVPDALRLAILVTASPEFCEDVLAGLQLLSAYRQFSVMVQPIGGNA